MELIIQTSTFKNKTLNHDWYNGQCPVFALLMFDNDFQSIEATAFHQTALQHLEKLRINYRHQLQWNVDFLSGLKNLKDLQIDAPQVENVPANSLAAVRRYLHRLTLINVSNELNLDNLFGVNVEKLGILGWIRFQFATPPTPHHLTKTNFSSLAYVYSLNLARCGIRSVEAQTFDKLSVFLKVIVLSQNELTTLPVTLFNRIVDNARGIDYKTEFDNNPLVCSCDLYELIGQLSNGRYTIASYYEFNVACKKSPFLLICPNLQIITTKRFLGLPPPEHMTHSKFILKMDMQRKEVLIYTTVTDSFRLWVNIENAYGESECPLGSWLRVHVLCLNVNRSVGNVSVARFAVATNITRICIQYVSFNRKSFWALHCISVYWPEERVDSTSWFWNANNLVMLVILAISVWGLITGFIINCVTFRIISNNLLKSLDSNKR